VVTIVMVGTMVTVTAAAAIALDLADGPPATSAAAQAATASGSDYTDAPGATTLAGTGTPGFNGNDVPAGGAELDAPAGIAEDAAGDLFIADAGNCRVREIPARSGRRFGISLRSGHLVTIVGGPCRNTNANPPPSALAVDHAGDLFIAFASANRVEELPAANGTGFGTGVRVGRLVNVAGTGAPGYGGDGQSATASQLDDPSGLAVDAASDLLIADTGNCRLRVVAATAGTRFGVAMTPGHIYTVAGNGTCGSAGDGGPSLQAELWDPGALTVDAGGDVLVADQGNRTIRELAAHSGSFFGVGIGAGDLGTVAGEGSYGPYLVDGLAALGQVGEVNFPVGIATDPMGNLYVADGDMHSIRLVAATTASLRGQQTVADDMYTAAGAVSVGVLHDKTTWVQTRMVDPTGLALSPTGRLIYSDAGADAVRELPLGS
jgi:NHL repeat